MITFAWKNMGFPGGSDSKVFLQCGRPWFDPWVRKTPRRREWIPTPVFLPGESHGQRSLEGYSPGGHKESDTTERPSHTLPGKCPVCVRHSANVSSSHGEVAQLFRESLLSGAWNVPGQLLTHPKSLVNIIHLTLQTRR